MAGPAADPLSLDLRIKNKVPMNAATRRLAMAAAVGHVADLRPARERVLQLQLPAPCAGHSRITASPA